MSRKNAVAASILPSRYRTAPEGQFLERKSCFDRKKKPKPRNWKKVAADVSETLVAFLNADGGEVVVGVDDDGSVLGVPYGSDQIRKLEAVGHSRISRSTTPTITHYKGAIVFQVASSARVHRTTSGKYLCRDRDANVPMDAERIRMLKALKRESLTEHALIPEARIADLDPSVLNRAAKNLGSGLSAKDFLLNLRLAEAANGDVRITFAALLLFARDPQYWHPRCHVEYIRFRGTERKHGEGLNIVRRQSIVAPLAELPARAAKAIRPHVGQRQILHDLFFSERSEYPEFAWHEAVINAVAHRDYGLRGTPIEIHHYDDRIEVVSPGPPVPPVDIETLQKGGGAHASRNPLIVRVLTLLGFMREVGEGVPRMFAEMAKNGLRPPSFSERPAGHLAVTLHNTPVWDEATRAWLKTFGKHKLAPEQMRLLVFARQNSDRFTSGQYQKLVGKDIYGASRDIKDLIRKGIVHRTEKRGRVYLLSQTPTPPPSDYGDMAALLSKKGFVTNNDLRRLWKTNRRTALRRAGRLVDEGWLVLEGEKRGSRYLPGRKVRKVTGRRALE